MNFYSMRHILTALLAFVGLTAGVCGIQMIIFPDGSGLDLPVSLLGPTPFNSFVIPGLILAFVVGGSSMAALFFRLAHKSRWYFWTISAGMILCGWIIGQMLLVQAANWLHFVYTCAGALIVFLALKEKKLTGPVGKTKQ